MALFILLLTLLRGNLPGRVDNSAVHLNLGDRSPRSLKTNALCAVIRVCSTPHPPLRHWDEPGPELEIEFMETYPGGS